MRKDEAQEIAMRMQRALKPLTAQYFTEEINGARCWAVGIRPTYGSPEYIRTHTFIWKDKFSIIMYLIGYASKED